MSRHARDLVAEHGDDTPIEWVHRDDRYGEKLATPDTSIADLIGEVDPIKVAEGRYLSDELTLHYGLVPRTNRGIFAINELPDLAERIQVGLLNVLEERDVQIRGYKIRLPLDVMLVASANPEDYTNRGRIITPLKDRFGSQIRTHYPLDVETEMAIVRQEARAARRGPACRVARARRTWPRSWPRCRQLARQSPHINQRSGVSVRLSRGEPRDARRPTPCAGRCASASDDVVPRVSATSKRSPSSTSGKVEIETLEEGRDGADHRAPVKARGAHRVQGALPPEQLREVIAAFDEGPVVHAGEDVLGRRLAELRRLGPRAARAGATRSPAATSARPPWRARSSSSSRACTSRSG